MIFHIEKVLDPSALMRLRHLLAQADEAWVDGRVTAGYQGAPLKSNQQLDERSEVAQQAQAIVTAALETHPSFISAALPNLLYPPMFNQYGLGMGFGWHVDGSIRLHPHTSQKLRTDLSMTLFLSDPDSYDGGELEIEDTFGSHSVKLPAGDMILYPSTSLHRVTPVTRGTRLACFSWLQSLVADNDARVMLHELDTSIQRLNQCGADELARRQLIGLYHNLVRKWSHP